MYQTAVCRPVNGGITYQKQPISENGGITQHYIFLSVNVFCFLIIKGANFLLMF